MRGGFDSDQIVRRLPATDVKTERRPQMTKVFHWCEAGSVDRR